LAVEHLLFDDDMEEGQRKAIEEVGSWGEEKGWGSFTIQRLLISFSSSHTPSSYQEFKLWADQISKSFKPASTLKVSISSFSQVV